MLLTRDSSVLPGKQVRGLKLDGFSPKREPLLDMELGLNICNL